MLDITRMSRPELLAVKMALEKDRLQRNLYDFAAEAWSVIDPAEFVGGGFAMQAVCDHLQACADGHIRNLIIIC